jgi:hypothetical protein
MSNQGHGNIEGFISTGDIKKDAQLLFELGVSRDRTRNELYGLYFSGNRDKTQQLVNGAIAVCYGPEKRG